MDDTQIERRLLELAFTTDTTLTPAALAFFAPCGLDRAEAVLDRLAATNTLRLESDADGSIYYVMPNRQRLAPAAGAALSPAPTAAPVLMPPPMMAPVMNAPAPAAPIARADGSAACPYCGEAILAVARKCKHCGEMLDGSQRSTAIQVNVQQVQQPPPQVIVHTTANRVSPGVAALLSFLWPGAGQLYCGRVGGGIAWFFFVVLGYVMLIVPGLILHLICIFSASSAAQQVNAAEAQRYLPSA